MFLRLFCHFLGHFTIFKTFFSLESLKIKLERIRFDFYILINCLGFSRFLSGSLINCQWSWIECSTSTVPGSEPKKLFFKMWFNNLTHYIVSNIKWKSIVFFHQEFFSRLIMVIDHGHTIRYVLLSQQNETKT